MPLCRHQKAKDCYLQACRALVHLLTLLLHVWWWLHCAKVPGAREPNPHVVRVASIYMLYALYHTQPKSHLVRIYIPLHLLRGLTWMASQSSDAALILKRLLADSALAIGAVRRPISGTKEARLAGYPTKLWVLRYFAPHILVPCSRHQGILLCSICSHALPPSYMVCCEYRRKE